MKKLVSLLLAVCMCLSVSVMLTACGHEHTWNEGEITTPATATADGVKTFTCTECGETKTESVALKTTVTEAEWNAAFALDLFSNVTVNAVMSQGDLFEAVSHAEICANGSYIYTTEDGEVDSHEYYQIDGDKYYLFSVDSNGVWHKQATESYQGIDQTAFANYFLVDLSNDYAGFSYDEATKAYINPNCLWSGYTYKATVNLIEGKIAKIVMESDYGNMEINYSDYGTTTIELPEIPEHTHTLTKVGNVAASCETAGNTEYYTCTCGKYFNDAQGTTEIAKDSWVLSATGHSYSDEWTCNETHHWKVATCEHTTEKSEYAEHTLTNNECTCGYVATTYTVTESEWNNLFVGEALNNVTINIDMKVYQTGVTEPLGTQNGFSKTTVDSLYQGYYDANGENLTYEEYLTQKDNKWYHLSKSNNAWTGNEIDANNVSNYTFSGSQGVCFVDKYSAFTYDTENKCYIAENFAVDSSSVLDVVKFYVENGKLVKMEFEMTNGTMRQVASYTFSDYGTTVIEVPEWTVAN